MELLLKHHCYVKFLSFSETNCVSAADLLSALISVVLSQCQFVAHQSLRQKVSMSALCAVALAAYSTAEMVAFSLTTEKISPSPETQEKKCGAFYCRSNLNEGYFCSERTLFKLLNFLLSLFFVSSEDVRVNVPLLLLSGSGYLSKRGSKWEPSSMLRSRNTNSYFFLLGCSDSVCWHSRFKNSSVMLLMSSGEITLRNLSNKTKQFSTELNYLFTNIIILSNLPRTTFTAMVTTSVEIVFNAGISFFNVFSSIWFDRYLMVNDSIARPFIFQLPFFRSILIII